MTRGQLVVMLLLACLVLLTATWVVYAKYASRKYFVELQTYLAERDLIEVEWGRLQLEQRTWARHGRIERMAREQLQMTTPSAIDVVVIRP